MEIKKNRVGIYLYQALLFMSFYLLLQHVALQNISHGTSAVVYFSIILNQKSTTDFGYNHSSDSSGNSHSDNSFMSLEPFENYCFNALKTLPRLLRGYPATMFYFSAASYIDSSQVKSLLSYFVCNFLFVDRHLCYRLTTLKACTISHPWLMTWPRDWFRSFWSSPLSIDSSGLEWTLLYWWLPSICMQFPSFTSKGFPSVN